MAGIPLEFYWKNAGIVFSKKASSYNQFKQTDIYKLMRGKGYYSANKKPVFEAVNEQETNELSETVLQIFASFSDFLKKSDLNEKDLQFCCLVKSRLTTLELSEIYCVSQSAIFKRKQKIKELLGFKSDKRTLDSLLMTILFYAERHVSNMVAHPFKVGNRLQINRTRFRRTYTRFQSFDVL